MAHELPVVRRGVSRQGARGSERDGNEQQQTGSRIAGRGEVHGGPNARRPCAGDHAGPATRLTASPICLNLLTTLPTADPGRFATRGCYGGCRSGRTLRQAPAVE